MTLVTKTAQPEENAIELARTGIPVEESGIDEAEMVAEPAEIVIPNDAGEK